MALAGYGPKPLIVPEDYSQIRDDIKEIKKIFEVKNKELPIQGLYITEDKKLNVEYKA